MTSAFSWQNSISLCPASIIIALLIIREIQIRTTMRYHLTQVKMTMIKKNTQTISSGEGVEERELSYTVGGNINCCSHYGEQYGGSSEN